MRSRVKLWVCCCAALMALAVVAPANATDLAKWTFESLTIPSGTTGTDYGPITPEVGSGTGSGHHASASTAWTTPTGNGSAKAFSSNYWAIGDYYQFIVSTASQDTITFGWDQTRSGTGPTTFNAEYSTDGTNFTLLATVTVPQVTWSSSTPSPSSIFGPFSVPSDANDKPAVYFRITCASAPSSTGGTSRIDNVTVTGSYAGMGSCCNPNDPAACVDNVPQSSCASPSIWTPGGSCALNCIGGACCIGGVCSIMTLDYCLAGGGVWFGPASNCTGGCPTYSSVVISQVYGGGGNAGAMYKNDFIELFNAGTATVAIGGWSVQYAPAIGAFASQTNIPSGIELLSGQYYLVQEGSGGTAGVALPPPDLFGTINLDFQTGKVALVNNQTLLSGVVSSSIVDLVGYGSSADSYETHRTGQPVTSGDAVTRGGNGCTQSHDNFNDFSVGSPWAHNASTRAPCSGFPTDGACCQGTSCSVMTSADCTNVGGTYWGDGSTCAHNICGAASGACCVNTYYCTVQTAADCATIGGIYEGDGAPCTPNPCVQQTDIAGAKALGSGVPVRVGPVVVASTIDLINSASSASFQVADSTGGLTLFGNETQDINPLLALVVKGDELTIEGTTSDYYGLFELNGPFPYAEKGGHPGVPAPIGVTAADFQDNSSTAEGLESEVVSLTLAVTFSDTGNFQGGNSSSNYTVTEVGTGLTMVVRISTNASEPPSEGTMIYGTPIPTVPVLISGIFSQNCSPTPCTTGYQLLPRNLEDFTVAPSCTTMGDLNVSGAVDALDIQCFVNCATGGDTTGCNCACGDYASPSGVGPEDIPLFVAALLGA